MFKVNNRNTRTRYEICLKLTIKAPERCHWCRSGVFIVNFEHISYLNLVFLLITLGRSRFCKAYFSSLVISQWDLINGCFIDTSRRNKQAHAIFNPFLVNVSVLFLGKAFGFWYFHGVKNGNIGQRWANESQLQIG